MLYYYLYDERVHSLADLTYVPVTVKLRKVQVSLIANDKAATSTQRPQTFRSQVNTDTSCREAQATDCEMTVV